ncbi:MAG: alpha/beta hydrolase family protein, partial [Actinomycetota bacterium]
MLVLGGASLIHAQAADPVRESLSRPVLAPGEALEDVQRFCETRVAAMPPLTTASEWRAFASRNRADTLKKVVLRGEAAAWNREVTSVEWQGTIEGGPGYRIRKLRYEVLPGVWAPALLYEPEKLEGNVPVVLNVNGHDADGKAADYKQIRCINLAKRGMLALNTEWFGMGQLRTPGNQHGLINAIDLTGTSGIATHYLALKRGLDVLLSRPNADATRVAVTGLSGGGWQTIFISGLDPRVTLSNPVAGYSSFRTRVRHQSDLGDSEQTPCDMASVTDYAQLTAMIAPRPALLTFNAKDDCCFRADHALQPLLDAAGPVYKLFPNTATALQSHINENPGTHNYLQDSREAFYRMLGQHFFADRPFDAKEIPSASEVKTKEQLHVELPSANGDLSSVALRLSKELPRAPKFPSDRYYASVWRTSQATKLRKIVRAPSYELVPNQAGTELAGDIQVTRWKLRLGGAWSVPAVELARGNPQETVVVLADGGRAAAVEIV